MSVELGLNIDRPRFVLSQPTTLEEGAMIAKVLLDRGLVNVVIWDTPAASQPAAIVNAPISDAQLRTGYRDIEAGKSDVGQIGLHARAFSHCLAALVPVVAEKKAILFFPNQTRTTINTWGAGETTPGGKSLKFHASIRARLSKSETKKETITDDYLGTRRSEAKENVITFHTVKNKTAKPFMKTDVRLEYGRGFLDKETLLDLAVRRKIIKKSGGGNFGLPGGKSIRGTENVIEFWKDNPAEFDKLKMELANSKPGEDEVEEVVEELEEGKIPF